MKRILFPIIAIAFMASSVLAVDAPPGPNPKLKELKYFAGAWQCKGTGFAFMGPPAHKPSAIVEANWTVDDYCVTIRYHERKTAIKAHPGGGMARLHSAPGASSQLRGPSPRWSCSPFFLPSLCRVEPTSGLVQSMIGSVRPAPGPPHRRSARH